MADYTVPMEPAAFLKLLGMDTAIKMSGILPPSDTSGIVDTALEKADAVIGGKSHIWSSDELKNAQEDVGDCLMNMYYDIDPADPGCFVVFLSVDEIPLCLRVTNTVIGLDTNYNGSSSPFRYLTRIDLAAFTVAE